MSAVAAADQGRTSSGHAGVWADLVGQDHAVAELRTAASAAAAALRGNTGVGMTHAWLFTGPPGSGRSVAARAFAATLHCSDEGCGQCDACHTVLAGTHADVTTVSTATLSIGVKETRELVRKSMLTPAGGRWQVIVLEDADRLTDQAGNVLLKAIEEPAGRTVWMLCAPSVEDVLPTLRSRCRHIRLVTPTVDAVADVLVRRDGIDPTMALAAARASQGHIGRARRLATDENARQRRDEVLRLPATLRDLGSCLRAAARLVDASTSAAREAAAELDVPETDQMRAALGASGTGRLPSGTASVLKELEDRQRRRARRVQRDALDRALVDLASFYRDVLAMQLSAPVDLVNESARGDVGGLARATTAESTVARIDAILACREALDANAHSLLAVESMMLALQVR